MFDFIIYSFLSSHVTWLVVRCDIRESSLSLAVSDLASYLCVKQGAVIYEWVWVFLFSVSCMDLQNGLKVYKKMKALLYNVLNKYTNWYFTFNKLNFKLCALMCERRIPWVVRNKCYALLLGFIAILVLLSSVTVYITLYSRLLGSIKNSLFPRAQIPNSAYGFMWIHWYMDKPMELLTATLAHL